MSATISRQTSFESPLQRRLSEEQLGVLQNRSFSVRAASDHHHSRLPEEPTSPLKRFARAKDAISRAFAHVRERLADTQHFLDQVHGKMETSPVSSLLERCRKIDDVLSRDHMKVAFFGRTSNGKSTVINALLQGRVLPAGIGHTTNCFCSVIGDDSSEGYLLKPGSEEKHSVKVRRKGMRMAKRKGHCSIYLCPLQVPPTALLTLHPSSLPSPTHSLPSSLFPLPLLSPLFLFSFLPSPLSSLLLRSLPLPSLLSFPSSLSLHPPLCCRMHSSCYTRYTRTDCRRAVL